MKKLSASIFAAVLATLSVDLTGNTAFAQQACDPISNDLSSAIYGIYAPSEAGGQDEFRGTAFVVDSRGILMTARHITRQLPQGSYAWRGGNTHRLKISRVLRSGVFGTALNYGDDWSIFSVDMKRSNDQSIAPLRYLKIRYGKLLYDSYGNLTTQSPPSTIRTVETSFNGFPHPNYLPCNQDNAIQVTISGYAKGESGSPLLDGACLLGITSQYTTREVTSALREQLDISRLSNNLIEAFELREDVTSNSNIDLEELIENISQEVTESTQDTVTVLECLNHGTPNVCARDFFDRVRKLNESLDRVSITPLSCVAESLIDEVVSEIYPDEIINQESLIFKGVSASPLVRYDLNPDNMPDFMSHIDFIEDPTNDWTLFSFLELLSSLTAFEEKYPEAYEAKNILRETAISISHRFDFSSLFIEYASARGEVIGHAKALREAQIASLKVQSMGINSQITSIDNLGSMQPHIPGYESRNQLEMNKATIDLKLAEYTYERDSLLQDMEIYSTISTELAINQEAIAQAYSEDESIVDRIIATPYSEFRDLISTQSTEQVIQEYTEELNLLDNDNDNDNDFLGDGYTIPQQFINEYPLDYNGLQADQLLDFNDLRLQQNLDRQGFGAQIQ